MTYKDYIRVQSGVTSHFLSMFEPCVDYDWIPYAPAFKSTPLKWLEVRPNAIHRRWE